MARFKKMRLVPLISLLLWVSLCPIVRASTEDSTPNIFGTEVRVGGSLKSIADYQWLRHENIFESSHIPLAEQRLRTQASVLADGLMLEYAGETSFFYQRPAGKRVPTPEMAPSPAWDAKWSLIDEDRARLTHRIDRLLVQLRLEPVEIVAGKQVVSTGVGQIFNAVSQAPRHAFVTVDPEYQATDDALSVILTGDTVLEARFLPKAREQEGHNFHGRVKRNLLGADAAITAGRTDDKFFVGLETAANVGDSVLLGELVGYAKEEQRFLQALVGFDRAFSAKWSGRIEAFYNGFGETGDYVFSPFRHRSAPFRGRWYLGSSITWDTTSRLKTNLATIVNATDPSALFHLSLLYSWQQNLDFMVGQYLNVKSRADSEFGGLLPIPQPPPAPALALGLPDMTYAALRWSF